MEDYDFSITVVGLGLIGASFAAAIKKINHGYVWGVDIDKAVVAEAENMGIIDKGFTSPSIPVKKSDIIICALYPELTAQFVCENKDNFKKNAVITDVSGLKSSLLNEVSKYINDNFDFIGGHPMAGKEGSGIKQSSPDIFINANYIITPMPFNKKNNIELIESIAKKIGCKNVIKVTPDEHDAIIAYTSHLPHVIAASLINCAENEKISLFAGGSLRDATRVAINNSELWTQLLIENRKNVINVIECMINSMYNIKNCLINEDKKNLKGQFENANDIRRRMFK